MKKNRSVLVLLSGGLDSSAALAILAQEGWKVQTVFFDYGQKARIQEFKASQAISEHYRAPWRSIKLEWYMGLGQRSQSALIQPMRELPVIHPSDLDKPAVTQETGAAVWVPNRNAVFANIAAAIAESEGIDAIALGLNAEEAATFPDNSVAFLDRLEALLKLSTKSGVQVIAPTVNWTKREIAQRVRDLSSAFPWDFVWSCYEAGEMRCGRCESCARYMRAVLSVGVAFS